MKTFFNYPVAAFSFPLFASVSINVRVKRRLVHDYNILFVVFDSQCDIMDVPWKVSLKKKKHKQTRRDILLNRDDIKLALTKTASHWSLHPTGVWKVMVRLLSKIPIFPLFHACQFSSLSFLYLNTQ